jgi:hypothetical protein
MWAEAQARLAARPEPEPYQDTRTPEDKLEATRRAIPTLEKALAAMKADVAAGLVA